MVISHISHHQTHREYFYCQTFFTNQSVFYKNSIQEKIERTMQRWSRVIFIINYQSLLIFCKIMSQFLEGVYFYFYHIFYVSICQLLVFLYLKPSIKYLNCSNTRVLGNNVIAIVRELRFQFIFVSLGWLKINYFSFKINK